MDKVGTRVQAYIALFNPTKEELANTTKVKMCKSLASVTSFSESTWSNNDVLKKNHVEAIECAKMKKLLLKVANSPQKLDNAPHVRVSLNLIEDIEHFLSREEK